MDRWKSRGGKSQRREEKRREEERRSEKTKSQRKEDAGARKGRKVSTHCVFQGFVAPEGRKVGSLKRRVRSHLARWEMENGTPLRREAHFEVKMYKAHHARSIFRSWHAEKVHAVAARRKHDMLGPLLKVQMWFCVAGAGDSAPCQKWAKRAGFVACPKTMAGVGIWRGSGKMHVACVSFLILSTSKI